MYIGCVEASGRERAARQTCSAGSSSQVCLPCRLMMTRSGPFAPRGLEQRPHDGWTREVFTTVSTSTHLPIQYSSSSHFNLTLPSLPYRSRVQHGPAARHRLGPSSLSTLRPPPATSHQRPGAAVVTGSPVTPVQLHPQPVSQPPASILPPGSRLPYPPSTAPHPRRNIQGAPHPVSIGAAA